MCSKFCWGLDTQGSYSSCVIRPVLAAWMPKQLGAEVSEELLFTLPSLLVKTVLPSTEMRPVVIRVHCDISSLRKPSALSIAWHNYTFLSASNQNICFKLGVYWWFGSLKGLLLSISSLKTVFLLISVQACFNGWFLSSWLYNFITLILTCQEQIL